MTTIYLSRPTTVSVVMNNDHKAVSSHGEVKFVQIKIEVSTFVILSR